MLKEWKKFLEKKIEIFFYLKHNFLILIEKYTVVGNFTLFDFIRHFYLKFELKITNLTKIKVIYKNCYA